MALNGPEQFIAGLSNVIKTAAPWRTRQYDRTKEAKMKNGREWFILRTHQYYSICIYDTLPF